MLKGKVAVVTGGSRGIGRAIALKMADSGADVAVLYAGNSQAAEETCNAARAFGVRAVCYQCNVADAEEVEKTAAQILEQFGGVDILVNNAGITRDALVLKMGIEAFDAVISTNLRGAFLMIKQFYPHMMRKRRGRIINIASVSGLMGNPGQANYAGGQSRDDWNDENGGKGTGSRNVTCSHCAWIY